MVYFERNLTAVKSLPRGGKRWRRTSHRSRCTPISDGAARPLADIFHRSIASAYHIVRCATEPGCTGLPSIWCYARAICLGCLGVMRVGEVWKALRREARLWFQTSTQKERTAEESINIEGFFVNGVWHPPVFDPDDLRFRPCWITGGEFHHGDYERVSHAFGR